MIPVAAGADSGLLTPHVSDMRMPLAHERRAVHPKAVGAFVFVSYEMAK